MPLTPEQRTELERLGLSEVRLHFGKADLHDYRATVTTLGGMLRLDVREWIAEKEREAQDKADRIAAQNPNLQIRTLFWAEAAFWGTVVIGLIGVGITVFLAWWAK